MKEEEQRVKDRLREEERLATPLAPSGKTLAEVSGGSRPLATVPPRESSSSQQRKDRERIREKETRRKERENENSLKSGSRKPTVHLPIEPSSSRGVKVHTVSPLCSNPMPDFETHRPIPVIPEAVLPPPVPLPEFSAGALEAMAVLKQRIVSPEAAAPPPEVIPLDLSEASVKIPELPPVIDLEPEEGRSLLDMRVERRRRIKERRREVVDSADNSGSDLEEEEEDLEEELNYELTPPLMQVDGSKATIPEVPSKDKTDFLRAFGLITPSKRHRNTLHPSIHCPSI